jgi:hypothetical protein
MGNPQKLGNFVNALFQDASNNVGIGAAPSGSYKLEVTGTAKVSSTLLVSGAATFGSTITASGNLNLQAGAVRNINFYDSSNTNINAQIQYDQISATSGQLFFGTNNAGTFSTKLAITPSGQIGIGTSAVDSTISVDIQNTSPSSNNVFLRIKNNVGSEDVGIKIAGTFGTAYEHTFGVNTIINSGDLIFHNSNSLGYRWYIDGTQRMAIASNGAVGINANATANIVLFPRGFTSGTGSFTIAAQNSSSTFTLILNDAGNLTISGSITGASKSFLIPHPLENLEKTHNLRYVSVESPQADLIYRGKLTLLNGKAEANIDEVSTMTKGTFEALCREVQCFTTNESGWDLIKGKVIGNIIYIESQNPNSIDEISWMVIGERKDKHMMDTDLTDDKGKIIVEPLKPNEPIVEPKN